MKLAPLFAVALLAGCSTASHPVVSTAGKVARGTVKFTGKTAVVTTKTAVQVAKTGVTAAGKFSSATTSAAVKVVQAPFVIFKDRHSGKTKQIPWEKGMTVASAGLLAKMSPPVAAFQVLRCQEILKGNPRLPLQPGDIVVWLASAAGAGAL